MIRNVTSVFISVSVSVVVSVYPPLTGLEVLGIEEPEHVYVCTPASAFGAKSL